MARRKQQNVSAPAKFSSGIVVVAVVLLATVTGCTTSQIIDQTAASTHVDTTAPQKLEQDITALPAAQSLPENNEATEPRSIASLAEVNSKAAASDPLIRDAKPITAALNAPIVTDERYPGEQNQSDTRLVLLQDEFEPVSSDANVMTYASLSAADRQKENLAQQRIDAINAQMTHGACKSGWATPPERLDASRIVPGHPYYLEIRLRNTPLFPVGHTYIAYGRLSQTGEPLEEHLVLLSPFGGYGGAAVAAAIPVPGILTPFPDDCEIKPHAAYRVTLDAQQYEQLLLRILKAQDKTPPYMLFAYNCNNFVADIVASVGLLPAKNRFIPAVRYIYSMIEANEGKDWRSKQPS